MYNINVWIYQGGTDFENTCSVGWLALPGGNSILILIQYYGMPLVQKKCKLKRPHLLSVIRRLLLITSTRDDFTSEMRTVTVFDDESLGMVSAERIRVISPQTHYECINTPPPPHPTKKRRSFLSVPGKMLLALLKCLRVISNDSKRAQVTGDVAFCKWISHSLLYPFEMYWM